MASKELKQADRTFTQVLKVHMLRSKSKEAEVNEESFGGLLFFGFFLSCNLIKVQYNELGGQQGLKSKSKIRLSEEEGEGIIAEIFSCSPETAGLLSNVKIYTVSTL